MRKTICNDCQKEIPVDESFLYKNQVYCEECLNSKIKSGIEITEDEILNQIDETVCSNCKFDNGEIELKKISHFPVCENCFNLLINRPFPKWIKISTLALIIIVLFGVFYNSKYFFAYLDIRESNKLFQLGKFEDSCKKMKLASKRLPHLEYLKGLSDFNEGMYLLYKDDSEKALLLFESYKKYYPDDKSIEFWILKAKSGVYYNSKDYQNFYFIQKELYKLNPDDIISIAGVSSGASCLYVTTGEKKYLDEMNEYFELAQKKMLPEQRKSLNEYIQRIKYRVYSGKIISSKEYYDKFPDGWKGDIK